MYRLCTKCKKFYKINYYNRFVGASILFTIYVFIVFGVNFHSLLTRTIIVPISVLVLTVPAWILIKDLFTKEIDCTVCNGKKTLIKLGTPKAIEIIKENNLSFPDESQEENKFPWEIRP